MDEVTLIARDAAAQSHRDLITKGVAVKPMVYDALLTPSQHEQIVDKVCACFEDSALHLLDRNQWQQLRPKPEDWKAARKIIQHWDLTFKECCQMSLSSGLAPTWAPCQDQFENTSCGGNGVFNFQVLHIILLSSNVKIVP